MIIFLAIYLLLGLISLLIGPLASELRTLLKEIFTTSPRSEQKLSLIYYFRFYVILLIVVIFFSAFYPIFFILALSNRRKKEKIDTVNTELTFNLNTRSLSFMSGSGIINCKECGYSKSVVAYIHNFSGWNATGFQCQLCGNFSVIKNYKENTSPLICECGGELSRKLPIFCPSCKSKDVTFNTKIIT